MNEITIRCGVTEQGEVPLAYEDWGDRGRLVRYFCFFSYNILMVGGHPPLCSQGVTRRKVHYGTVSGQPEEKRARQGRARRDHR